jgi:capsular exopolysaccharide synthesis family protein
MGKMFEALDKTGLTEEIFQGELGTPAQSPAVPAPAVPESAPAATDTASTAPAPAFRCVSLRLPGGSPVLPFEHGNRASEQYRILRTRIIQHAAQPRVILVSSSCAGDGKSVTAINLAGALSLKGTSSVLLVDGDLRRPSIWSQLGVEETPGLADVLAGAASLDPTILKIQEFGNLHVLLAGKSDHNPTELLDSEVFSSTLARLKQLFRYIIIDSPPIASVADSDLLTATADGVIVVVRPDHTNRQACAKVLESIPKNKFLGVVMNRVSEWFLSKSYGYSGYYY